MGASPTLTGKLPIQFWVAVALLAWCAGFAGFALAFRWWWLAGIYVVLSLNWIWDLRTYVRRIMDETAALDNFIADSIRMEFRREMKEAGAN
jgi:small-conductance mechanosensitive channel